MDRYFNFTIHRSLDLCAALLHSPMRVLITGDAGFIARHIVEHFHDRAETYGAERPGDVKHSVGDMDKTRRAGFRPVSDLAGGLRATIELFRKSIPRIEQGPHL